MLKTCLKLKNLQNRQGNVSQNGGQNDTEAEHRSACLFTNDRLFHFTSSEWSGAWLHDELLIAFYFELAASLSGGSINRGRRENLDWMVFVDLLEHDCGFIAHD